MTTNILYGSVVVIEGALSANQRAELVRFANERKDQFVDSFMIDRGQKIFNDSRTSKSFLVQRRGDHDWVDAVFLDAFVRALASYRAALPALRVEVRSDEGYQIIRYGVGGEYRVHNDDAPDLGRKVSAVMYLNDDYEGGELFFPAQGITFKPKSGDVIMFPSCYAFPHASLPVKTGVKFAVTTWFA